ncbi:50S ribosomal protein L30 [Pseudohongiella sp. SYSU M77423]|jgi:large subunit ribosomal protein L30|uniref:50S ribosomal protein L30 n=1 Tax=unclassified Pseudohongiella TaxID=2629611 RepID=UPI000C5526C5|nr:MULTISPECIES: 50S ribosomal protein L30 [unclassified Pseudohongiella]MAY56893.1 50S ribosomal protein L30 [Gammaproteobacteria bacterium]MBJ56482.1 50S ribosomal protein L30 [Gammaproteobacteria bacterium]MDH7944709.1 50S ribosomal protein L30 [Pseudohongiella sp. SYSU M77423]HBN16249.1 50S ribosomal protein L30 [Pseudohongiella sp.]|tara:strand:+ start:916 stop:1098 length:183 start_codon:yes stop_codon:yes gene_type:complete
MANKTVKVTLVRSPIGTMERHRQCLKGLGLRRMHQTVELQDTPAVRGIINKISYMLQVEG